MGGGTMHRCLRCQGDLRSMGVSDIRVGGVSGGWQFLFGNWAEVSEDVLPLEILVCRTCGKIELRVPGAPASNAGTSGDEPASAWDAVWGAHDRHASGSAG